MELITTTPAIPLKDGSQYEPPQELIGEWQKTYRQINVIDQLQNMRVWCLSNPQSCKTKRGVTRFINGWLSRQKPDRAVNETRYASVNDIATDTTWAE